MNTDLLFWTLLLLPIVFGLLSLIGRNEKRCLQLMLSGVLLECVPGGIAVLRVFGGETLTDASGWLTLDALSAYHLAVMLLVFLLSSAFAWRYFTAELDAGYLRLWQVKTFTGLWCPAMSSMVLALTSANFAMMWIGIEATSILTTFLICIHMSRGVLEAMWKYLVICSVGTALAFLGTLFVVLSAHNLGLPGGKALFGAVLLPNAAQLDPMLMKAAFIFLLVGYGTKAGLAPMHSWMPDAYSKAPAPVSALSSGFMLNAALYCLLRYLPIVDQATGAGGWPLKLLLGFGMVSMIVAAAYIFFQRDVKRLLAYSSVEHAGIIALGLGLGGAGTFAALFHTLNHSLCKSVAFFAAGRLGQVYGSHQMDKMTGSLKIAPIWGSAFVCSLLALIGVAPFSIFISELLILKAAIDKHLIVVAFIFLLGTASVFMGVLGHAIPLALGKAPAGVQKSRETKFDLLLVLVPLAAMITLGLWLPDSVRAVIESAAQLATAQALAPR